MTGQQAREIPQNPDSLAPIPSDKVGRGHGMFHKRASPEEGPAARSAADVEECPEAVLRDELGLHQLWYLELRLRQELARSARTGAVFSLTAWQLRLLPGERPDPDVIQRSAALIVKSLRSYDLAARIDDERFVALLFDADYNNATTVAFRIKGELQIRVPSAGRWQAGVATFQRDGVDGNSLIQAVLRRLQEDAQS